MKGETMEKSSCYMLGPKSQDNPPMWTTKWIIENLKLYENTILKKHPENKMKQIPVLRDNIDMFEGRGTLAFDK